MKIRHHVFHKNELRAETILSPCFPENEVKNTETAKLVVGSSKKVVLQKSIGGSKASIPR